MQIKPLSCCGVVVTKYDFDLINGEAKQKVRPWH